MRGQSFNQGASERKLYAGPLYSQLTGHLRDRIRREDWRAGTLLPSESEIARQYGVSVGTARKALDSLATDGWVLRLQGRGTFVNDLAHKRLERLCRFEFSDGADLAAASAELIENKLVEISDDMRTLFTQSGATPGPNADMMVRMVRLLRRGDQPCVLEVGSFPAQRFPGLEQLVTTPTNLFSVMIHDYEVVAARSSDTVDVRPADARAAALLGVDPGSPLVVNRSVVASVDGDVVALFERWGLIGEMAFKVELS